MSAPSPPPQDARIEHILLQTVPWDARKKGGNLLQDCLRDLWEKAVSIGFKYGEENIARAREEGFNEGKGAGFKDGVESRRETTEATEAAPLHEKALEAERLWGYDVGWKLCCELQKSRASQASFIPLPHPSPRSLSIAATQTDAEASAPGVAAASASVVAAAAASVPVPLDWAEDAATLPTIPLPSELPPSTLRDFSVLRTSSPQPFASLQRRRRRSPRPPTSQHPFIRRPQQNFRVHYAASRPRPPLSIPFPNTTSIPPSDKPAAKFPLDWDQDPRLRDLVQALAALGWVRP